VFIPCLRGIPFQILCQGGNLDATDDVFGVRRLDADFLRATSAVRPPRAEARCTRRCQGTALHKTGWHCLAELSRPQAVPRKYRLSRIHGIPRRRGTTNLPIYCVLVFSDEAAKSHKSYCVVFPDAHWAHVPVTDKNVCATFYRFVFSDDVGKIFILIRSGIERGCRQFSYVEIFFAAGGGGSGCTAALDLSQIVTDRSVCVTLFGSVLGRQGFELGGGEDRTVLANVDLADVAAAALADTAFHAVFQGGVDALVGKAQLLHHR